MLRRHPCDIALSIQCSVTEIKRAMCTVGGKKWITVAQAYNE